MKNHHLSILFYNKRKPPSASLPNKPLVGDAVNAIINLSETHIDYSTGDTFKQDTIDAFQNRIAKATALQNNLPDDIVKSLVGWESNDIVAIYKDIRNLLLI